MTDFHPFVVHFPIALLLTAAGFDLFSAIRPNFQSNKTGYILQILGALGAIIAAFSGNLAETAVRNQEQLSSAVNESLSTHVSYGNAMVWIIVILVLFRSFALLEKKEWASKGWLFPALAVLVAILVVVTGFLGGNLSHDILQYFINSSQ